MTKVLVTVPELEGSPDAIAEIRSVSPDLEIEQRTCRSNPELTGMLGDAEILYTLWFPTRLEPDAVPIGEYCIFAMGLLARGLLGFYRDQQQRVRNRAHSTLTDLTGLTVGIVGYGQIGRHVARLSQAFNMRVLASKRNPDRLEVSGMDFPSAGDPTAALPEKIFGPDELPGLLADADFIVSTVPLTAETTGLFGESAFRAMRRDAYFINVSRGGVVDHDALVQALQSGEIRGACLDVLHTDPKPLPPENPLWDLENVLITPHVSGNRNAAYMRRAQDLFIENLKRYLAGESLLNVVTRDKGY